ncbi:hypothetical protein E6C60_0978 [Paenibacillus algicola]|uniref:Uncharacterized protein n=1 Tax=Paenibacillus algicola TaxID=2565926 RepID=A0A4P8XGT6_9BACL|nr:hypothetical protein E6C60_0978 [Paenibacillus algicola]
MCPSLYVFHNLVFKFGMGYGCIGFTRLMKSNNQICGQIEK